MIFLQKPMRLYARVDPFSGRTTLFTHRETWDDARQQAALTSDPSTPSPLFYEGRVEWEQK